MLEAFLDYQRGVMLRKMAGISREQLLWSSVPSGTSLLGMVRHLGYVERWWFRMCFAGEDTTVAWSKEDPDGDWRVGDGETVEGVEAFYRDEIERARTIVASAGLDDHARRAGREGFTLRWIMVHMIEETARHLGHADILREQIDGSTGD
jgi:hypothetical protein